MSPAYAVIIGAIILIAAISGLWALGMSRVHRRQTEQLRKIRRITETHGGSDA